MKHLVLCPMSPSDAMTICSWSYLPPYHIYNWPSWEEMCETQLEFADEEIRSKQYCSIYQGQEFIGFIQLFTLAQVLRLAIFLSPQHCDQGIGQAAVTLAVTEARNRNANAEIDLEVECWNIRAIKCYEKAGFSITDHYQYVQRGMNKDVYCMVYRH